MAIVFADWEILLAAHSQTLGEVETTDTGKMLKETRWQAKYIAEYLHFYAGAADKVSGETLPIDKPGMFVFTDREPLGVIAAIVPWNSQLFLSAVKIGPALAAGNTIVLKASEHASAAMLEFGGLIAEAGIPDGVVNIVTGHGDPCGQGVDLTPSRRPHFLYRWPCFGAACDPEFGAEFCRGVA